MSRCAEAIILLMLASIWEAPEAYIWGLSEIHNPDGTCM